jgi:hypothetical protein
MASRTHTYENLDGRMAANGAKIYVSTLVGASLHPKSHFFTRYTPRLASNTFISHNISQWASKFSNHLLMIRSSLQS